MESTETNLFETIAQEMEVHIEDSQVTNVTNINPQDRSDLSKKSELCSLCLN